jgi:hypothetical protein
MPAHNVCMCSRAHAAELSRSRRSHRMLQLAAQVLTRFELFIGWRCDIVEEHLCSHVCAFTRRPVTHIRAIFVQLNTLQTQCAFAAGDTHLLQFDVCRERYTESLSMSDSTNASLNGAHAHSSTRCARAHLSCLCSHDLNTVAPAPVACSL